MGLNENEIKKIADSIDKNAILVFINEIPRWILVDKRPCTIDVLAQGFNSDTWEQFCDGKLIPFDEKGNQIINPESTIAFDGLRFKNK
jgi:hypothetical protein